ncbi:MAG: hypothetical protein NVS3B20_13960 [Polyangiales bacterium]
MARLNRLTACLSVHILFGPLCWVLIVFEIRIGTSLLHRPPPAFSADRVAMLRQASHALLAWGVGALCVAPVAAVVAGAIAYPISRRYLARKALRDARALSASLSE